MKNKGEILTKILDDCENCLFFLHNTKDKIIVERIMNEGFIFENQLSHSTDRVNPCEPIEVTYFLFQRKDYGPYTIIIAISKAVFESYTSLSNKYDTVIEDVLTITDPFYGDNDELIYTLSPKHVLGYFDNRTGEFIRNEIWDPEYSSAFMHSERIRLLNK